MKDTDKITLSVGQLKKLIKESKPSRYLEERRVDLWYIDTTNLAKIDEKLYNIVNSCSTDHWNARYKSYHTKVLQYIFRLVQDKLDANKANYVAGRFIGLFDDEDTWPPSLMFDGGKAAKLVAIALTDGTDFTPEDICFRG